MSTPEQPLHVDPDDHVIIVHPSGKLEVFVRADYDDEGRPQTNGDLVLDKILQMVALATKLGLLPSQPQEPAPPPKPATVPRTDDEAAKDFLAKLTNPSNRHH